MKRITILLVLLISFTFAKSQTFKLGAFDSSGLVGKIDGRTIELQSTITCSNFGHKKKEIMPTDACQFFYECKSCKQVLKPKQDDCCVYCSYGAVKCPSMQLGVDCS